jgi:hypothetical protein
MADAPEDDRVPFFGTWRVAYTAVIVWSLLVMAAIALFSSWNF